MAHRTTEHFTVGDSYHLTAVPVALSPNACNKPTLSFSLFPAQQVSDCWSRQFESTDPLSNVTFDTGILVKGNLHFLLP